ncbi:hypothetical protein K7B10_24610 [Streptomyces flavotricini]|uniref:Glycerophosphoryl diester phosphodiesterase membrane domain-containing protein n=1 Tax=Streptomyces flavotricini TaxID=66888 RepID=A0ABS8E9U5_9ACTN|nr:hypothetical protein [Streptomyces flavotricini]MCC0097900.1 hypothetical protein [Streptomyces flavotricini]
MNDSPGWAAPGPSPSDGERSGTPDGQGAAEGAQPPPAGGPKWSAEQPPPGEWSSPGSPQAPQTPQQQPQQPQPGTGWGSYGGPQGPQGGPYGHPAAPGQWGKPPAAKPGVIPLRPLDLGEILDGAVATVRSHWRSVLPITLVVATVVQVISVIVQKYTLSDLPVTSGDEASLRELVDTLGGSMLALVANGFIQLIGTIVATAMVTMIFSRAVLGHSSTIGTAWREARPQLLRLLGLTLLLGIGGAALVGVLLLPGIALGSLGLGILGGFAALPLVLWLGIKFSLASPALMLEKSSVATSLRRSSRLVQGSWWRIFGITALTGLITTFVSAIIVWPLTAVGLAIGLADGGVTGLENGTAATGWAALILSAVGAVIAQTITMPIQSGVTVLLYVDQRIRREALDLELARAAGLENYGSHPAAPPTGG